MTDLLLWPLSVLEWWFDGAILGAAIPVCAGIGAIVGAVGATVAKYADATYDEGPPVVFAIPGLIMGSFAGLIWPVLLLVAWFGVPVWLAWGSSELYCRRRFGPKPEPDADLTAARAEVERLLTVPE